MKLWNCLTSGFGILPGRLAAFEPDCPPWQAPLKQSRTILFQERGKQFSGTIVHSWLFSRERRIDTCGGSQSLRIFRLFDEEHQIVDLIGYDSIDSHVQIVPHACSPIDGPDINKSDDVFVTLEPGPLLRRHKTRQYLGPLFRPTFRSLHVPPLSTVPVRYLFKPGRILEIDNYN